MCFPFKVSRVSDGHYSSFLSLDRVGVSRIIKNLLSLLTSISIVSALIDNILVRRYGDKYALDYLLMMVQAYKATRCSASGVIELFVDRFNVYGTRTCVRWETDSRCRHQVAGDRFSVRAAPASKPRKQSVTRRWVPRLVGRTTAGTLRS